MSPDSIIRGFQLLPHPEGGHYREIFRSPETVRPADGRSARSALTLIHFLLRRGETSAWHRVLSDETWHWCGGAPMELWLMDPDMQSVRKQIVGPFGEPDSVTAHVVPARWWQAARPAGDWSMVQCAVAPGFDFADFTMLRDDPAASILVRERHPEADEFAETNDQDRRK
jgi:predicted cupin superfamily sugar epimerase